MDDDHHLNRRQERGFDAITLLLAGALATIVVGAVGYGVARSSKVASVPLLTGQHKPTRTVSPPPAGQQAPEAQGQETLAQETKAQDAQAQDVQAQDVKTTGASDGPR